MMINDWYIFSIIAKRWKLTKKTLTLTEFSKYISWKLSFLRKCSLKSSLRVDFHKTSNTSVFANNLAKSVQFGATLRINISTCKQRKPVKIWWHAHIFTKKCPVWFTGAFFFGFFSNTFRISQHLLIFAKVVSNIRAKCFFIYVHYRVQFSRKYEKWISSKISSKKRRHKLSL